MFKFSRLTDHFHPIHLPVPALIMSEPGGYKFRLRVMATDPAIIKSANTLV
jgi:hypothetical protein